MKGYTGISFPFRIGNRGGIVMSSTSHSDVAHIEESIIQILSTNLGERVMDYELFSDIDTQIFEVNNVTTHNFIKYQIVEALGRHEPRIEELFVESNDIIIYGEEEKIFAEINYRVVDYGTNHTIKVNLGGVDYFR